MSQVDVGVKLVTNHDGPMVSASALLGGLSIVWTLDEVCVFFVERLVALITVPVFQCLVTRLMMTCASVVFYQVPCSCFSHRTSQQVVRRALKSGRDARRV